MNTAKRKPTHPGFILNTEFMVPLDLKQQEFADEIGVTRGTINEIVNERRSITPDTAVRLSKALGTSPAFWLNLQSKYDLWETTHNERKASIYKKIRLVNTAKRREKAAVA